MIGHGGRGRGGKKEPERGDTPDFVSGAVPSAFAGDSHQAPGALSPSFSLLPPEEINIGSLALKWSREDSAGVHTRYHPLPPTEPAASGKVITGYFILRVGTLQPKRVKKKISGADSSK